MPTLVDFPTIVQEALAVFGNVFDTEAARRHFAEYLTGLMVAERKTVSGINREFALTTDQSCLNRWLMEVQWDGAYLERSPVGVVATSAADPLQLAGGIAINNTALITASATFGHSA